MPNDTNKKAKSAPKQERYTYPNPEEAMPPYDGGAPDYGRMLDMPRYLMAEPDRFPRDYLTPYNGLTMSPEAMDAYASPYQDMVARRSGAIGPRDASKRDIAASINLWNDMLNQLSDTSGRPGTIMPGDEPRATLVMRPSDSVLGEQVPANTAYRYWEDNYGELYPPMAAGIDPMKFFAKMAEVYTPSVTLKQASRPLLRK